MGATPVVSTEWKSRCIDSAVYFSGPDSLFDKSCIVEFELINNHLLSGMYRIGISWISDRQLMGKFIRALSAKYNVDPKSVANKPGSILSLNEKSFVLKEGSIWCFSNGASIALYGGSFVGIGEMGKSQYEGEILVHYTCPLYEKKKSEAKASFDLRQSKDKL